MLIRVNVWTAQAALAFAIVCMLLTALAAVQGDAEYTRTFGLLSGLGLFLVVATERNLSLIRSLEDHRE